VRTIAASVLKAKLLAVLDEIAASGEGITVLKRRQPVAQILPAVPRAQGFPQDTLRGTCRIIGDVMTPW
jgi:antitoxin (DNA-binding transcriptional repressor) of toxin-antitoxin stability system